MGEDWQEVGCMVEGKVTFTWRLHFVKVRGIDGSIREGERSKSREIKEALVVYIRLPLRVFSAGRLLARPVI